MNSTELIAAIRHTLMTGLAHNAAIAALNEIAASINSVVCEATHVYAAHNKTTNILFASFQDAAAFAAGYPPSVGMEVTAIPLVRTPPPPGSARDSAEAQGRDVDAGAEGEAK